MSEAYDQPRPERTQYQLRVTLRDPEAVERLSKVVETSFPEGTVHFISEKDFILDPEDEQYAVKKRLLDIYTAHVVRYNTTPFPIKPPVEFTRTLKAGHTALGRTGVTLPIDFGAEAGHRLLTQPFFTPGTPELPLFEYEGPFPVENRGMAQAALNEYLTTKRPRVTVRSLAIIKTLSKRPDEPPVEGVQGALEIATNESIQKAA